MCTQKNYWYYLPLKKPNKNTLPQGEDWGRATGDVFLDEPNHTFSEHFGDLRFDNSCIEEQEVKYSNQEGYRDNSKTSSQSSTNFSSQDSLKTASKASSNLSTPHYNPETKHKISSNLNQQLFNRQTNSNSSLDENILNQAVYSHEINHVYGDEASRLKFYAGDESRMKAFGDESQRLYTCPYPDCGYQASRLSWVTTHYRKHSGEKPFSCQFCSYKSAQKSNLKVHMRKHLDQSGVNILGGMSFQLLYTYFSLYFTREILASDIII